MFIFPCYYFTNFTQFSFLFKIGFSDDYKTILTIHKWPFTQKAAKEFDFFFVSKNIFIKKKS